MVLDPMPPFHPDAAVAEPRDHHGVLERNGALVIVTIQRPGLHLSLVELAAMQQPVKRMQIVIAHGTDMAECCFQFFGAIERRAATEREGGHPVRGLGVDVHSVISMPSAGICQPARSTLLRSGEACSSAGLELLICKNIFRPISRPARLSIAPLSPDIEICPIP